MAAAQSSHASFAPFPVTLRFRSYLEIWPFAICKFGAPMSTSPFARLHRRFGPRTTSEERRQMLKATFLASAGLLISGNRGLAALVRPAFGAKRVCVVGGGFSGLACAYE